MKLHELLAVEKSTIAQVNVLLQETLQKFGKDHFFKGWVKRLKMIKDSADNDALERAAREDREVPTTVIDTLTYVFDVWGKAEDIQYMKNIANQNAAGSLQIGDNAFLLPVDELMGLENRLLKIREIFQAIPTLDATKNWISSDVKAGVFQSANPEVTTKTEKVTVPVILYEATANHPAQVKEVSRDDVVGTFTTTQFSGAISSLKKADALMRIDNLLGEVKKARMRANMADVHQDKLGQWITDYLLEPLK